MEIGENQSAEEGLSLISDVPNIGPLTEYRKMATFDWKRFKLFWFGEETLRFKAKFYNALYKEPLFQRDEEDSPDMTTHRQLNFKRWQKLLEINLLNGEEFTDYRKAWLFNQLLDEYDQGLAARHTLSSAVFYSAILSMGTERHWKYLKMLQNYEIFGCFCLSEMSHGSNTKALRTEAKFDAKNDRFILHTPDIEAAKVWSGNLGQSATHGIIFAQLYTNQKNDKTTYHGLHAFVVQVRDMRSLKPLPGLLIGDMGPKPGAWNGVENGWLMFDNFPVPRENLLNRQADVSSRGVYTGQQKNDSNRRATSLGSLSMGRVGIIFKGVQALMFASVIAVRYSAVRKQFGPDETGPEWPVIEFQLQRRRLLPYLAAHFALKTFHQRLNETFSEYLLRVFAREQSDELRDMGREIHGLSCAAKPISTWLGVAALGEARQACGGHGYLKASRLNDLRDDHDPTQTYEGDNNMLLMQTGNYLTALLEKKECDGKNIESPMRTVNFLNDMNTSNDIKLEDFDKSDEKRSIIEDVLNAYSWLGRRLLTLTSRKIARNLEKYSKSGQAATIFKAKSEAAVYNYHSLAMVYGERTIIAWFYDFIRDSEVPEEFRGVLNDLCGLFALWSLEKHLDTLYIEGYYTGPDFGYRVRNGILQLCDQLKANAIALCDVIAPPDHILHSVLGNSDGEIYQRIFASITRSKGAMQRPDWWPDMVAVLLRDSVKSKI